MNTVDGMEIRPMGISGSFLIVPGKLNDDRGDFWESYKEDDFAAATGHRFRVAQTNFSTSRRGVLRGIHGVAIPPAQAKVVTCHRGAVLDVVVDVRIGSPTFGAHVTNRLSAAEGAAVFVAEGLGHGFLALTDDTVIGYLCSTAYVPGTQLDLDALDPALAIDWSAAGVGEPIRSAKDAAAPTVAQALAAGLLPPYEDCLSLQHI